MKSGKITILSSFGNRKRIDGLKFKGKVIYKPLTPTKVVKSINIIDENVNENRREKRVESDEDKGTFSPI